LNRLFLVRHGGSTGNVNELYYAFHDSAVCLTTEGVNQALSTAGVLVSLGGETWLKPGNFNLEVFASEYSRAQQTARICLDQMGILSIQPKIRAVLNERNYGVPFNNAGTTDPFSTANGTESAVRARIRMKAFVTEIEPLLERADVLAFSHEGSLQALLANLRRTPDRDMMKPIPNGSIFLFERTIDTKG
jgi:broad specificity phosphatase PhoE